MGFLTVPAVLGELPAARGGSATEATLSTASSATQGTSLTIASSATNLSPVFWGTTVSARAPLLPQEGAIINATPTQLIVWPGGSTGDEYDPLTNTLYSSTNGTGTHHVPTNATEFAAWCRSINCSTIFEVPGEIDNPSLAAQIVNYTERTLHLTPKYWEIGNEPERWNSWKLPWNQQSSHNNLTVNPWEYAWEVHNYSLAMRTADPNIHIIGLPGTGRPNGLWVLSTWVNATIQTNAANLSGVAFHDYPAGTDKIATLPKFYAAMNSDAGLPNRVKWIRSTIATDIQKWCPSCNNNSIPLLVTEVGSALSNWHFASYSAGFPGALDMAAQMTQAIDLNLINVDLYASVFGTSNSWFNTTGGPHPDYTTYSQFLNHLGTQAYPVNLTGFSQTLYGIATLAPGDRNRRDLLVVNTNTTTNATFTPTFPGMNASTPTETWEWDGVMHYSSSNRSTWVEPRTPVPVDSYHATGLTTWTLPSQSMALFEAYPGNSTSVRFQASNLTQGTRWFLSVGQQIYTTTNTSFTLLLDSGQYSLTSYTVPLPLGSLTPSLEERLGSYVSSPFTVDNSTGSTSVSVGFAFQWSLNLSTLPANGGQIDPSPSWANASQPLNLTAVPAFGYDFTGWFGSGSGSVNNVTTPGITIVPTGPISEKAHFQAAFIVNFTETGLPTGRLWSVDLRGTNESSTNATIMFAVPYPGVYGFTVESVPGYVAQPSTGSVNVTGAFTDVSITFKKFNPEYPVAFIEMGLPAGTAWSVALRGVNQFSNNSTISFAVTNGTYGFEVGNISGYRAHPPAGSLDVSGAPWNVSITFQKLTPPPPTYPVYFQETGLPSGTNWTVSLRGVPESSTSSIIAFDEPNGTWGFKVGNVTGYRTHPPAGSLTVTGGPVIVTITFQRLTPPPLTYPVYFQETGLPAGTNWTLSVRGVPESSTGLVITFYEPNGTWGFKVANATGYRAHPSAGSVNVSGAATGVPINFTKFTPPPLTYPVYLLESGLPAGTNWSATVRGVLGWSTSPVITFYEPNGTWGFKVANATGYRAHPSAGSVNVSGAATGVPINFTRLTPPPSEYPVTFLETGLPTGTAWSVALRGVNQFSINSTISFLRSNSTYGFKVGNVSGYRTHPSAGSVIVAGGPAEVAISFSKLTPPPPEYSVTFEESGLPAGTSWTVSARNVSESSTSAIIVFAEPSGKWGFKISNVTGYRAKPPAGSFLIAGGPLNVSVAFTKLTPPPTIYPIYLEETGLPAGTNWTATVRNVTESSTSPVITFYEPNGTWGFKVAHVNGYRAHPPAGKANVSSGPLIVPIGFTKLTPPPPPYAVAFLETGLLTGTSWSVTVRGATNSSTTGTIGFESPNGTYGFQVAPVSGYRSQPTNSAYTVNGTSVNVSILFYPKRLPPPTYRVSFVESGLSAHSVWSVTVRNVTVSSPSNVVQFNETNGSYGYQLSMVNGFARHPRSDGFTVAGHDLNLTVGYLPVKTAWSATWKAKGIWNATWWVVLNGTNITGAGGWRTTHLHNGSYNFTIGDSADFVPIPRLGSIQVNGRGINISVNFSRAEFPVVFSAHGISVGTVWAVRLGDRRLPTEGLEADFMAPNATYTFLVEAPFGYYANVTHGNLTVQGVVQSVGISFTQLHPPIPSVWLLGTRAAGVAIVFGGAAWGGFALMGYVGRRGKKGRRP